MATGSVSRSRSTATRSSPGRHSDGYRASAYTFAAPARRRASETARLTATDGVAGDFFGNDVPIDGQTVVVSAFADDVDGKVDQGSAYTFSRTGANPRTETAKTDCFQW